MSGGLRQRLALALFALTTLAGGLLAAALWAGHVALEHRLLDDVLNREFDRYLHDPASLRNDSSFRLHRSQDVHPAALNALLPGSHRDQRLGGGIHHIVVRDLPDGTRAWLLYDVREFERREERLGWGLLGGLAALALAAWWLSGRVADRLLHGLHDLLRQLRAENPGRKTTPLAVVGADADLQVILDALNRLLAEVDALLARERAFASAAAHELRTPLATVRAAAEVLGAREPSPPLARIERAVDAASRQLDALLALSHHRPLPDPESIELREALPAMAAPFAAAHVRLDWRVGAATLRAPRAVFEIVYTNLLRNALRAAADVVTVTADAQAVTIEDDGAGIEPTLRARLFEPGVHGAGGGSGMGLYIARSLAERAGWRVSLEPRTEGEGTRATLSLSA